MNLNDFLKKMFGKKTIAENPSEQKKSEPVQPVTLKVKHELENDCKYYFPKDDNDIAMLKTNIAGVNFKLKIADARKAYQGHTKFEPENPANDKAVALITDDGRHIGYISERDLRMYYDIFDKRDGIRFYGAVGVFTNDKREKTLFGNIMVVDIPNSDDGTLFDLGQKQLDFMMAEFLTE